MHFFEKSYKLKGNKAEKIPQCSVGDKCCCPTAPLDGRHLCAICNKQLHGPCGVFNGDDAAITFRNRCFSCPGPIEELTFSTPSPNIGGAATIMQQFAIISTKDVDAKKVAWEDIVPGDWLSVKPGESSQMSNGEICSDDLWH
jgi:hypothetical protein